MAKVKITGHASGTGIFTVTAPNSNTDRTITLPDGTGTLAFTTGDDDKLPLAGGAMTGAITTNSTFDGVDIATRDAILTSTTTTADAALPKAGGAMTGAITTNSTFDGVDIAVRDAILTSTTTTAGAALPKAGGTMSGDLILEDNVKIELGNASGGDLQIYHNASNSYVSDQGTGHLKILGTHIVMMNAAEDKNYLYATDGDSVALYFNNAAKLATSNTGVTVTGTLAATALTGDGSALTGISAGSDVDADGWILRQNGSREVNGATINHGQNTHLGSNLSEAGGKITIGTAGWYFVIFRLFHYGTDSNDADISVRINSTDQVSRIYWTVNTSQKAGTGFALCDCSASDEVHLYGSGKFDGAASVDTQGYFMGFRLGGT